jgi:hypothetical protein
MHSESRLWAVNALHCAVRMLVFREDFPGLEVPAILA